MCARHLARLTFWFLVVFEFAALSGAGARNLLTDGPVQGEFYLDVQHSAPGEIDYAIHEKNTGKVLLRLASSYQPDEGDLPNWAMAHASGAHAYWNEKGDLVAIDEAAHNYEGTVLLAIIGKGKAAREISLPVAGLLSAVGKKWDKFRFGCPDGWVGPRQLAVELVAERGLDRERIPLLVTVDRSGKVSVVKPHLRDGNHVRRRSEINGSASFSLLVGRSTCRRKQR